MKHGDSPKCGIAYGVRGVYGYCKGCGEVFSKVSSPWALGDLVRYSAAFLKSTGKVHAPIDGRVVGMVGNWPIVQWSNGYVSPVSSANVERTRTPVFTYDPRVL